MNKRTLTAEHPKGERRHGSDPYNNAFAAPWPAGHTTTPSRDETVRVATLRTEPHSASSLSLQIAGLRVELERLLTELGNLRRRSVNPGDLQAVRLRVQIRDASQSLEEAVARLMPLDDQPTR